MKKEHSIHHLPLLILLICTLFLCAVSPAFAASGAIDLVIVLDDSGSMYKGDDGNDAEGYRFDAASIMLNMCSIEGSRAAVLYFADETREVTSIKSGNNAFYTFDRGQNGKAPKKHPMPLSDISLTNPANLRKVFTDKLSNGFGSDPHSMTDSLVKQAQNRSNPGPTHLGNALYWAIDILDQGAVDRGDRQPMILVLADGKCDDPDVLEKALIDCKDKGYKVYTILLQNKDNPIDESDDEIGLFRSLSSTTGALDTFSPSDATDLPNIFTEIFADQIGSEVTPMELVSKYDEATDTYIISIPVPNKSVAEANIMMPTSNGLVSNIKLCKPGTNTPAAADRKTLFIFETSYFNQFKLIDPTSDDMLGVWKLIYKKHPQAQDDISVNIVFSYNIELEGSIQTAPTTGTNYYKGDLVDLRAVFVDDQGQESTDELLYRGATEEDPNAIRCYVRLVPKGTNDAAVQKATAKELNHDSGNRCFYLNAVSAADFGITRSGDYEFVFTAEGDGLIREAGRIPYTIINQAPAGNTPAKTVLEIEDPNAESLTQPDSATIDFTGYISDPDRDPMSTTVLCADKSLVSVEDSDAKDSLITVGSLGKAGATTIDVTFNDSDQNGKSVFTLDVEVVSVKQQLENGYEPRITIIDPQTKEDGTYENGSVLKFAVTIEPKAEAQNIAYNIADYDPQLTLWWVGGDNTGRDLEIPLEKDTTRPLYWTGEFKLPNNELNSAFEFVAKMIAGNDVLINTASHKIGIDNQGPYAIEDTVTQEATVEPFTLFGMKLGKESTEPWDKPFSDFFADPDVNDELKFEITSIEGDTFATVTENEDRTGLHIVPVGKGQTIVHLKATDPSKLDATCDYVITMVSNNDQVWAQIKHIGLIAAITAVVAFILYSIFRPRFNNLNLKVYISDVAQKSVPLGGKSKTKAKLAAFTTNEQRADNLHQMLSTVEIRPCWINRNSQVKVSWKNSGNLKVPNTMKIGAKMIKDKRGKKQLVLKLNDTISMTVKDQKHSWRLERSGASATGARRGGTARTAGAARPAGTVTRRPTSPSPYN